MSTFLDRARDLLAAGTVADRTDEFQTVFKALVRLRDVFYKSGLDLDNIESVFAAFEMAQTIGKFADYSEKEIADLTRSIRVLIVRTLDESIKYTADKSGGTPAPPVGYDAFVNLVKAMRRPSGSNSTCSLLTFNYDIALDYALTHGGIPYDYGLEPPTGKDILRVLKLHGSLNWGKCPKCGKISASRLSMDMVLKRAKEHGRECGFGTREFTLPAAQEIAKTNCVNCSCLLSEEPVIVPPTWNKTEGHSQLTNVWRQAAIELGQAENIICMGYSLPESDLFFRYLFALGTVGEAHLRRFWVFDPDPQGVVEERYRRLIGRGIERRFRFFKDSAGKFVIALKSGGELWKSLI
jgi:hypothetical protein